MPPKIQRSPLVSQAAIDHMKKIGMKKALEIANSGTAGAEFEEGARRMYGKRVHPRNIEHEQNEARAARENSRADTGNIVRPPSSTARQVPTRQYQEPGEAPVSVPKGYKSAVVGKAVKAGPKPYGKNESAM